MPDLMGGIALEAGPGGLRSARFGGAGGPDVPGAVVTAAAGQLREYFAGQRSAFDIPLDPQGTPFQLAVWRALMAIPYGQTACYRDIAVAVGRPKGFQAIGQANTRNPIPIIVPCHRVINADGSLGGYGGGVDRKRALLEMERRYAQ
jgi:methylated-DNA-[protein]-cysteine S-methyltransferase